MNKTNNVFIGVAWPYVNGTLHIGHYAGYLLPADITARYHRLRGDNVLMVSGSDCFGTPITIEADKQGISPEEVSSSYHKEIKDLLINKLDLSYDIYTKTNHNNHIKTVQDLFVTMLEKDLIYADTAKQFFSVEEKRFLPDRYIEGQCPYCGYQQSRSDQCDECGSIIDQEELINPKSVITKGEAILKKTEHYFVDWSKLEGFMNEYVSEHSQNWRGWTVKETNSWLTKGLQPRAITRDIGWGVPLPVDRISQNKRISRPDKKRIYVWFEAVVGYLSGSMLWAKQSGKNWEDFWHENKADRELKHYYFMGKDNLVFHTLFWPAQLHSFDPNLHLPDSVIVNMFLNYEGKQFSKSKGIVIEIGEMAKRYGNEIVRFYLTSVMPENKDASFIWKDFVSKVNNVLVGNFGNLVHRTLSLHKDGVEDTFLQRKVDEKVAKKIRLTFKVASEHVENGEYKKYLNSIFELSTFGNKLFDNRKVYKLKHSDVKRYKEEIYNLHIIIIAISCLISPVMPATQDKIFNMLNIDNKLKWPKANEEIDFLQEILSHASVPEEPVILFEKIEPDESLK